MWLLIHCLIVHQWSSLFYSWHKSFHLRLPSYLKTVFTDYLLVWFCASVCLSVCLSVWSVVCSGQRVVILTARLVDWDLRSLVSHSHWDVMSSRPTHITSTTTTTTSSSSSSSSLDAPSSSNVPSLIHRPSLSTGQFTDTLSLCSRRSN